MQRKFAAGNLEKTHLCKAPEQDLGFGYSKHIVSIAAMSKGFANVLIASAAMEQHWFAFEI